MKFEEMDATAPLAKQLQEPYGGSVVLINKFTVALEDGTHWSQRGPTTRRTSSSSQVSYPPSSTGGSARAPCS